LKILEEMQALFYSPFRGNYSVPIRSEIGS
jgi:hypothetical protein